MRIRTAFHCCTCLFLTKHLAAYPQMRIPENIAAQGSATSSSGVGGAAQSRGQTEKCSVHFRIEPPQPDQGSAFADQAHRAKPSLRK